MNDWFDAEQHVERAHELYEAGRWTDAEQELREALALNPFRPEWQFNLGLTLEAAGRWREAVHAFGEAHRLDPDDYQTLLMLAVNCLRGEMLGEALRWCEVAHGLEPDRADSYVYRIEAYARLGRHDDAELMFYHALQLEGDHAQAYGNMAECLIDRGEFERAAYCLREAASLDRSLPRVHARLAYVYEQTGRHERARQLYLRELRDHPLDVETQLDLGWLLVDMNRLGEAAERFRRVNELESDNADAHVGLADVASRQRRLTDAHDHYDLALRADPEAAGVRRRLAELHLGVRAIGEARRLLRADLKRLRRDPARFEADELYELGGLLLEARLPRESREVLQLLVERSPGDADGWHRLGVACFETGDAAAGVSASRRSTRLDPKHVAALHNLALAMVREGRWRRARAYLRRALAVDGDDVLLRRLMITVRLRHLLRVVRAVIGRPTGA